MNAQNVIALALSLVALVCGAAEKPSREPLREFEAPDADQGVAVDADHVYVIDNTIVAKHDKYTGELVKRWAADEAHPLIHMNSGMVRDGTLYCAHSNYPRLPMTSSVEMWDTATLEHVGSHSFGVTDGSLTWMDWHNGFWWGCFAHYDGKGGEPGKDHTWTRLVQFNSEWCPLQPWVFPKDVLGRFAPHSCSGGAWGSDGLLYVTGHDRSELYTLELPESGSVLRYMRTVSFPVEGQAIAFDRAGTGLLYGLRRSTSEVVAADAPDAKGRH
ncbi:MAG: hypothetical protein GY851_17520 [bacterium]|nr:hypothetical protein [bacterium]